MKQLSKRGISEYAIRYIKCQLLGNLLTGKGTIKVGDATVRARQDF